MKKHLLLLGIAALLLCIGCREKAGWVYDDSNPIRKHAELVCNGFNYALKVGNFYVGIFSSKEFFLGDSAEMSKFGSQVNSVTEDHTGAYTYSNGTFHDAYWYHLYDTIPVSIDSIREMKQEEAVNLLRKWDERADRWRRDDSISYLRKQYKPCK